MHLNQVDQKVGAKTNRTRYVYDNYGNVVTTYKDGDLDTTADDSTIYTVFYPNTTAWILDRPARQRVYATIMSSDDGGANLRKETNYYYDGNNTSLTTPPTVGSLTRLETKVNSSASVSTYYTYDVYGNQATVQDPNGNTTTYAYDSANHAVPVTRTYPAIGGASMSESYVWDYGGARVLSETDVNGQTTSYEYDTFKRVTKLIRPGDSSASPTMLHEYLNWGTINQEQVKTTQKIDASNSLWQKRYFDGVGRVVELQAQGETGKTIVTATTFNNRGLTDSEYVPQNLDSSSLNGYTAPVSGWKFTQYQYDGLSRVTTTARLDGTTVSNDYTTAWQDTVTNERGLKKHYYYDAFNRLTRVDEMNDSAPPTVYATTTYGYDVLNNLVQAQDASSNTTTVSYDWLSRKTSMADPDMGAWSYGYDSNGNLTGQTDAKSQTITFAYDALNRLTGKAYPAGSGTTNVSYTYDSTSGGNYGKGRRTGMADGSGSTAYIYDAIGRTIEEDKTINDTQYGNATYTTQYTYDSADRLKNVKYPNGWNVTQTFNGRGLPYSLYTDVSGMSTLISSAQYNQLGQPTDINQSGGLTVSFGYWGVGGTHDATGGYYGKLWEIKTTRSGFTPQDVQHTWDAGGNLTQRVNLVSSETENFSYDFLDRLTGVSGAYSESNAYNQIGNLTSKGGQSYTYGGGKPHAVTAVGSTGYAYDSNGNMAARGAQTLTWDVENRPVTVAQGGSTIAAYVYDGDGKRVKKTESGATIVYVNKYYEKNLTTGDITTYYYLGDRLVVFNKGLSPNLHFVSDDHLTGTSVITNQNNDTVIGSIRYMPFGAARAVTGTIETEVKFTGQRLDSGADLYYYGARYYDANIGRFISADTFALKYWNPQELNRYSYALNNPLRYIDPSGHQTDASITWNSENGTCNVSSTILNSSYAQYLPVAVVSTLQNVVKHGGGHAAASVTTVSGQPATITPAASGEAGAPVSVATPDPDTVIAKGTSPVPATPSGTTAGVGPGTMTAGLGGSTPCTFHDTRAARTRRKVSCFTNLTNYAISPKLPTTLS